MRALLAFGVVFALCACEPRSISFQSPTPSGATTASAAGSASPSGSARPTPRATLRPLPTAATVSRLLSYERGGDLGPPAIRLLVLADGRVITEEPNGELFYRRLSPSGAATLLLQAIATGYFDKDASYPREPLPGSTPPAHGATYINFIADNGGRDVRVSTIPSGQPDDNLYKPSAARDKLSALALSFEDLSWLPASAWTNSVPTNYSAQYHVLLVVPQPGYVVMSLPDVDAIWPFTPGPASMGQVLPTGTPWRCTVITAEDAALLGDVLSRERAIGSYTGSHRFVQAALPWSAGAGAMTVQLDPLLPHETPTCASAHPLF